jgi:hypothetical protein
MDSWASDDELLIIDLLIAPTGPSVLPEGWEVPVAVCRKGDYIALLSIFHDADNSEEPFQQGIEIFERVGERWSSTSIGGSDWPVAYGDRGGVALPLLTGFASGTPLSDGGMLWFSSGIAPPGSRKVRVTVDGVVVDAAVHDVSGGFLVAVDDPAPAAAQLDVISPSA